MTTDQIKDGVNATTGGERTTTKPKINQPQQAQNIAGSGGTWPKYQTLTLKTTLQQIQGALIKP